MSENVDTSLRARFEREQKQALDRQLPGGGGGDGPHIPGMEQLVDMVAGLEKRMETKLDGFDARLRTVEQGIVRVDTRLDGIGSKLDLIVSQMPRWYQAPLSAGALVTLILGLLGLAAWLAPGLFNHRP